MASSSKPDNLSNSSDPSQQNRDPEPAIVEANYSFFSHHAKILIVACVSAAAFFSPVSSNIYFPVLNVLAAELNVSDTLINLTLTSFLIFQGLAPTMIGTFSDVAGRRPAYMICFVIYLGANIGLALQSNYAALFVLRCVQSSGSSGTITLAIATVADISTTSERGRYIGYATAGALLGPAFGPLIGGVLAQYLGWRSIFWFLTITAAIVMLVFLLFFPETCRAIVGNGSIPPKGWHMSLLNYRQVQQQRKAGKLTTTSPASTSASRRRPNPFSSIKILFEKESFLVLLFSALLFSGFYAILGAIPSQFAIIYGFDDFQIGLCYIPVGVGALFAALINGRIVDWNFKRHCKRLEIPITKGRQSVLKDFPIERARLEIAIPLIYCACALNIAYGWIVQVNAPLAGPLVILFFTAYTLSGAFNVMSTLLVDIHPGKAGAATAANNLARCLTGAGFTAAVLPLIDRIGRGWTYTFVSLLLLVFSPLLWAVVKWGPSIREARRVRVEISDEKAKAKAQASAPATSTVAASREAADERQELATTQEGDRAGVAEVEALEKDLSGGAGERRIELDKETTA